MTGKRIAVVAILLMLLCMALVGGQYGAGAFLLQRLDLDPSTVGLFTLSDYYGAYGQMEGTVGKLIKLSLALSFLPAILIVVMGLAAAFSGKSKVDKLYGDARFSTDAEIAKADMFYKPDRQAKWPAVLLGKKGNRYIADYSQEYTTLSAEPGAMKGVSFVIPNLLTYDHSMIVFDPKTENFSITAGYRHAEMGQEVYQFSPDNRDFKSHCWNPLDYISDDPRRTLSDVKTLTSILLDAPEGPNQGFYLTARDALNGILMYMMETPEVERTMYQADAINTVAIGFDKWVTTTVAARANTDRPLSDLTVRLLAGYAKAEEKSRNITRGIISTALSVFTDAMARAATRKSDFSFHDLRKKRMTIYVAIQPDNIGKYEKMLNIFFSQAISVNTGLLPEEGPKDEHGEPVLKYQCLALLDEFVALGRIQIIEKSSGYTRAYNMRYACVFQNRDQVFSEKCYGRAAGMALLGTMHNEIVFATESTSDAEEYSKRLGNTTLKYKDRSHGRSSGGSSTNDSIRRESRALMLPQEIQRLPRNEQIIFKKGGKVPHPIHCEKIIWYQDPFFKPRANLPTPEVPDMEFH